MDSNETEQLQVLKNLWDKYGLIMILTIVFVVLGSTGWEHWRQWRYQHTVQASIMYEHLLEGLSKRQTHKKNETIDTQALIDQLITDYDETPYAIFAALIKAREAAEDNRFNDALKQLHWAEKKSQDAALKAIITLRIARTLFAMKQSQLALAALKEVKQAAFLPAVQAVRGAIFASLGKNTNARLSYEKALSMIPESESIHEMVHMQYLDVLSKG